MLIPRQPFPSYAARNRAFDSLIRTVGLCESVEELQQLREEIADDLARLTASNTRDIHAAIAEAFSAQAALIQHKTEYPL